MGSKKRAINYKNYIMCYNTCQYLFEIYRTEVLIMKDTYIYPADVPLCDEVMAIRQAEDDIEQGNVMSLSAADL